MSVNETVVEVIKFSEQGLSSIAARTKAMGEEADEAQKKYRALLAVVSDRRYNANQRGVEDLRRKYEAVSLNARNYALQQRVADGSAAKHLATVTKLNKQHELMQFRVRNTAAAQGLADGSTAKQLRAVAKLNDEYARMQRRAELAARYGERIGGLVAKYGTAMNVAGGIAGGVAATGLGLARQGFGGTVEEARVAAQVKQIGRELAGALKPVADLMLRGTKAVRERLERTGEGGQNAIMGGLLVGGTAAGAIALRSASQLIGAVAGETLATRLRGGALRAGVGLAGAGALAYGLMAGNVTSGALGGAALGFSVGGLPGAAIGAAAGGLAAKAQGTPAALPGEKPSEYYSRRRRAGASVAESSLDVGLESVSQLYYGIVGRDDPAARRQVQLAGGGYEESGQGFERIVSAIEKVEGERDRGGGLAGLGEAIGTLSARAAEIVAELRRGGAPLDRPGG